MSKRKEIILLIDDDQEMLKTLVYVVKRMGFQVLSAAHGEKGLSIIRSERPDLLIVDLMMRPMNGLEVLKEAKSINPELMVILMTGFGSIKTAVEAIRKGAINYIQKPINADHIQFVIDKAFERKELLEENRRLRHQLESRYTFQNIVGRSQKMRDIYETIERVAPTDASVLISGESGTGKELVARAVHAHSLRKNRSFTAVDCVSLPGQLMESELFGYEKGAFTGAASRKLGLLEMAKGGTFFMDEVTEIGTDLQAKLLRVLQERQFRRLGGRNLIHADVRIISASKHDPEKAVEMGKLREDLFYRLNVIPIKLPPLRKRKEDIPLLIHHFLKIAAKSKYSTNLTTSISPDSIDMLQQYHWPGNVRELKNMIERLSILAKGECIEIQDIPSSLRRASEESSILFLTQTFKQAREQCIKDFEKKYMEALLDYCQSDLVEAMRVSCLSEEIFQHIIQEHNIAYSIN